jgi:hypothetical protein
MGNGFRYLRHNYLAEYASKKPVGFSAEASRYLAHTRLLSRDASSGEDSEPKVKLRGPAELPVGTKQLTFSMEAESRHPLAAVLYYLSSQDSVIGGSDLAGTNVARPETLTVRGLKEGTARLVCQVIDTQGNHASVRHKFPVVKAAVAQKRGAEPARTVSMEERLRLFSTDDRSLSRFYELPMSEVRLDRLARFYESAARELDGVSFDPLNQQERIDYLLLRNRLRFEQAELKRDRQNISQLAELLPFRERIHELEQQRWKMASPPPQASALVVAESVEQIKELRQRLERGLKEKKDGPKATDGESKPTDALLTISPVVAQRTARAADAIRNTLRTWYEFHAAYQPDFSWWLKQPYDTASKALEDYVKFLREEVAGLKGKDEDPLIGEPLGREALLPFLAAEHLAYSPEELIAIGEREMAWCEEQMRKAAGELGYGEDWQRALAKVKDQYVSPGQQDELIAQAAKEALEFVKSRELVTVPGLCEETWRVAMVSPEGQKTLPYAAYGGQQILVAYAAEPMAHADKLMAMRGNNRHFTRIVTAHELIPGHHLQRFVSDRNRTYRDSFGTPFAVEGWAVYWELRLWELGYGRTAEERIGMLFWRMQRSARIVISLKFHLGQMSPQEMVTYLVERVGNERLGATSEVRRYIGTGFGPLYQCAYMVGALQLRALHREVVQSGRMSEHQFHDEVLSYSVIPYELVRAGMLNLPLTKETAPGWRFAEPVKQ